jgi:hypothetical protein
MDITKIVLIVGSGPDHIYLHTNLPEPCYPYEGNAQFRLLCAAKGGEAYVKSHFPGVPYEIVLI